MEAIMLQLSQVQIIHRVRLQAGDATMRLETLAGLHKVASRAREMTGLESAGVEEFGAFVCDEHISGREFEMHFLGILNRSM